MPNTLFGEASINSARGYTYIIRAFGQKSQAFFLAFFALQAAARQESPAGKPCSGAARRLPWAGSCLQSFVLPVTCAYLRCFIE